MEECLRFCYTVKFPLTTVWLTNLNCLNILEYIIILHSLGEPVGDNDRELSGEVLADGWILDVRQLSWTKVVCRAKVTTNVITICLSIGVNP